MNEFEYAEYLYGAATREAQAGRILKLASLDSDADHHFLRARELKNQADSILDQFIDQLQRERLAV